MIEVLSMHGRKTEGAYTLGAADLIGRVFTKSAP